MGTQSSHNKTDVEQRAKQILKQHGLYAVPVDPVLLASRLGVTVNNAKFADDSWAASIVKRGSTTRIFVEQSDPPYRKRFSIAHELGHHLLHLMADGEIVDKRANMFRERTPDRADWSPRRFKEIEANWFAAELLMPKEFVRTEWRANPNVATMAKIFNVSEQAMGYRIDGLGLWEAATGT